MSPLDSPTDPGTTGPLFSARQLCGQVLRDLRNAGLGKDGAADAEVVLNGLLGSVDELFERHIEEQDALAELLLLELEGYLTRSATATALIRRPDALLQGSVLRDILVADKASGDGAMGLEIDTWLRQLPTLRALRDGLRTFMKGSMRDSRGPVSRVLCMGAEFPGVVEGLVTVLQASGVKQCEITLCSDATTLLKARAAEARVAAPEYTWSIQPWMPLVDAGDTANALPPNQDRIWIPHLLEALPDRLAVAMLVTVRRALTDQGRVVTCTLADSPDTAFVDHLLRWPTIRRSPSQLLDLFVTAGLAIVGEVPVESPSLAVLAQDLTTVSRA